MISYVIFTAVINLWPMGVISIHPYTDSQWPFQKTPHEFESPTIIPTGRAEPVLLEPIDFYVPPAYENEDIIVLNTGVYAEVKLKPNVNDKPSASGGPLIPCRYVMEQMHFHWSQDDSCGSEHHIEGHHEATELHLVMYNDRYENFEKATEQTDGVAVFAFFGHLSKEDNPDLSDLVEKLDKITEPESETYGKFGVEFKFVKKLIDQKTYYFAFPGSLTTEPYSKCVTWLMYPHAFPISHNQLQAFRNLISKDRKSLIRINDRPIQDFQDRPLIVSIDRYW